MKDQSKATNSSRRVFFGSLATAVAPVLRPPLSAASDRIRLGVIGPGSHGQFLVKQVLQCENVEVAAFADVYERRLEEAMALAPGARAHKDYRRILDDKSIDAVIVATPQHLHCEHFVAAIQAGKHVYQEKALAFTIEHAKKMRAARNRAPKLVVQVGHQDTSSGPVFDAMEYFEGGQLGKVTEIHGHFYRNTPHGQPQWTRPVLPDMTPERIDWKSFLGGAPQRPFDANRYINWRFFWDYSGGNFYENMSHSLAFWHKAARLQIPKSVTTTGGVFLWNDGREVPDTMCVSMVQPEGLLYNWTSSFGNDHLRYSEYALGTDGTITVRGRLRYFPQRVNRPDAVEATGKSPSTPQSHRAHLQNFFDCVRSGKEPNCPFDLGFRVAVACRMTVDSYRQGRTVKWDPVKEQIV